MMFSMTKFTSSVLTLFALALTSPLVEAAPLAGSHIELARDIFDPPILYPNAMTVWFAGQTHNVTWDASNPPKSISNGASIVLRTADIRDFTQVTLAAHFSLLDGRHEIKLPNDLKTRDDYEIVLFGDSGNISPAFAIIGQ